MGVRGGWKTTCEGNIGAGVEKKTRGRQRDKQTNKRGLEKRRCGGGTKEAERRRQTGEGRGGGRRGAREE